MKQQKKKRNSLAWLFGRICRQKLVEPRVHQATPFAAEPERVAEDIGLLGQPEGDGVRRRDAADGSLNREVDREYLRALRNMQDEESGISELMRTCGRSHARASRRRAVQAALRASYAERDTQVPVARRVGISPLVADPSQPLELPTSGSGGGNRRGARQDARRHEKGLGDSRPGTEGHGNFSEQAWAQG